MRLALILALALAIPAAAQQTAPPAPAPPVVEKPELVRAYPHDTTAFTEGLLIADGTMYESTGREGQSVIRQVDLTTGKTQRQATVPDGLFGEGIVAWGQELRSVTWHGGRGFRWSRPALKRVGEWRYEGEGWAMTDDGHRIILSDGTPRLRFLDPATMKVARTLDVTVNGRPLKNLNELEFIDGQIWANVWMTRYIVRIDPASGQVVGVIDLGDLIARVGLTDPDSVANGIAFDRVKHRIFVTGKNWPELFEIRLPVSAPAR
ncbi:MULTISPECIES: glutaminyl-peptide cyclotransferase [unclassified Sphingomonas]|uniref:glutaminyl-peptide cyclotransferase n=1 Tax=unclassified Sphingomonas TaxID=196159 RepID=UPI00285CB850|nr:MULTISPECIES: glutaminyl-peptide cyclotransferase [unclassified Sphingomonas]MDR6114628.1 glutamine cyclotransferase [Sphingomonas sp. SORGH_AS_0789]MDR6151699.1 glutamine cyclotransferase [Sphingomonas sp. SORGH_AS_0742]